MHEIETSDSENKLMSESSAGSVGAPLTTTAIKLANSVITTSNRSFNCFKGLDIAKARPHWKQGESFMLPVCFLSLDLYTYQTNSYHEGVEFYIGILVRGQDYVPWTMSSHYN